MVYTEKRFVTGLMGFKLCALTTTSKKRYSGDERNDEEPPLSGRQSKKSKA
jgi:hypothetical protein